MIPPVIGQVLKDISTGKTGLSYDVIRILAIASVAIALWLTVYQVIVRGEHFNMQEFGLGLGAVFLSVGTALKLGKETEPS